MSGNLPWRSSAATPTGRATPTPCSWPTSSPSSNEAPPMLPISRRDMLAATGTGLGLVGLALLGEASGAATRKPHFAPKAKRLVHLFMNGGPSQVDTFDPKPALDKY